jgi:hypothetical protein
LTFAIGEAKRVALLEGAARLVLSTVHDYATGKAESATPPLEAAAEAVSMGRTPVALLAAAEGIASGCAGEWSRATSISAWVASLGERASQIREWLHTGRLATVWLGGLLAPQAFATAVKQDAFRFAPGVRSRVSSLDGLSLHASVTSIRDASEVTGGPPPGEGVLLRGLYLHGAAWVAEAGGIVERPLRPQVLHELLPVVALTAIPEADAKRAAMRSGPTAPFQCPVYATARRGDKALVCMISLPSREQRAEHWIMRGVAVLLQEP